PSTRISAYAAGRSLNINCSILDQRPEHAPDRFTTRFAVAHLHMTSHNCAYGHTFDFPTMPRRGLVLAVQFIDVDCPFLVHIDNSNIAVRAEPNGALFWIDLPKLS